MDKTEAIKRLEDHMRIHHIAERPHIRYLNDAFIEAITALKMRTPMEHHHTVAREVSGRARYSVCPNCLWVIVTAEEDFPKFCSNCGQAIEWEE